MSHKVRVIHDETGWTDVVELASHPVREVHLLVLGHSIDGLIAYENTGERDAEGLEIFRTRAVPEVEG